MKIGALVHMYPPLHNAGAEHMLHGFMMEWVRRGVECRVVIRQSRGSGSRGFAPYVHDGVSVSEDLGDLEGVDALITHLDRTPEAEAWCKTRRVPCVQVFHNDQRPKMAKVCDLAVFNSEWIAGLYPGRFRNAVVAHPPVWADLYRVKPGARVTLINLQPAKGVGLFYELAAAMPDVQFLGVFGAYGAQVVPPALENLTLLPQQRDVRRVYADTRLLLMPSEYESYGRCALEAAVSGIPTIAHPTPGLKEALGDAGMFPAALTVECWRQAILDVLVGDWGRYSKAAKARAATLDPGGDAARVLAAIGEAVHRGAAQTPETKARLRYPITLGVDCRLEGRRYPKGSRVGREIALALRASGQLKDERII